MVAATVNTDASFCHRTRAGGWAAWISVDGGVKLKASEQFKKPPKTSTEAEYWAMLNGCYVAARRGVTTILVQGDCKSALAWLTDGRQNHVKEFYSKHPNVIIRTKWIKGHRFVGDARSWVNRWCDEEAKKRMRQMRISIDAG